MTERELLKVLSGNIKLYRSQYKWSQAKLSEKIDISINFLSDIENAKKWPSPTTMVKLANIFNINVYELLKPQEILPDNFNPIHFMENYTEDIFTAITGVQNTYTAKFRKKKKLT